jgi:hypothetical protein
MRRKELNGLLRILFLFVSILDTASLAHSGGNPQFGENEPVQHEPHAEDDDQPE